MSSYQAGIGGPLVNMDGNIIGMNFYSEKIGTLSCYGRRLTRFCHTLRRKGTPIFLFLTLKRLSVISSRDEHFNKLAEESIILYE